MVHYNLECFRQFMLSHDFNGSRYYTTSFITKAITLHETSISLGQLFRVIGSVNVVTITYLFLIMQGPEVALAITDTVMACVGGEVCAVCGVLYTSIRYVISEFQLCSLCSSTDKILNGLDYE